MKKILLFLASAICLFFITTPIFAQNKSDVNVPMESVLPLNNTNTESKETAKASGCTIVISEWGPREFSDGTISYKLFDEWVEEYLNIFWSDCYPIFKTYLSNGNYIIDILLAYNNIDDVIDGLMAHLQECFLLIYGGTITEYYIIR